jgi:hypothetical protein
LIRILSSLKLSGWTMSLSVGSSLIFSIVININKIRLKNQSSILVRLLGVVVGETDWKFLIIEMKLGLKGSMIMESYVEKLLIILLLKNISQWS